MAGVSTKGVVVQESEHADITSAIKSAEVAVNPSEKVAPVYSIGTVKHCSILNVRKGASAKSEVVGTLERYARVSVNKTESTESYFKVSVKGLEGYCLKEFIELVEV